jgi:hypothetical protein
LPPGEADVACNDRHPRAGGGSVGADAAESIGVWRELDGHEVRVARSAGGRRHVRSFRPHAVVRDRTVGEYLAIEMLATVPVAFVVELCDAPGSAAPASEPAAVLHQPAHPAEVCAAVRRLGSLR